MRLATIETGSGVLKGALVRDDTVVPTDRLGYADQLALICADPAERAQRLADALAEGEPVTFDPGTSTFAVPFPRPPRNMFCIGTNYQAHYDEGTRPSDTTLPEHPVVFTKPWTTLVGDGCAINVPDGLSKKVDWEAEVAVVIGRGGRFIPEAAALAHVAAYTLANDVSARDLQLRQGNLNQWFMGKSADTFCPAGPWLTTADELAPDAITFELEVNGVGKQRGDTRDLIFGVAHLVHILSRVTALLPGDVILTGTPSGVGQWREPQEFLHDGDVVTITSPQLGRLSNPVVAEPQKESS